MASKELYNFYKSNGICVTCGQENAVNGRVRCHECLAKSAMSTSKLRSKKTEYELEIEKESKRKYRKILYEKRKKERLCVFCGKPICSKSTVYCIDHMIKNQKNNRSRTAIPRQIRAEIGLCVICGKDNALDGKKTCIRCYENCLKNAAKARNSENAKLRRDYVRNLNKAIFNN